MTVIDLSQVPSAVTVTPPGNTGLFNSALIASAQTIERSGKWGLDYSYAALAGTDRAGFMATMAAVRGQSNRLRVPIYGNPKGGAYGGTPKVNGGSQTGFTIAIDGCSNSITNWIKAGDYFSIIVNGEPELKMCTTSASSNGSGQIAALAFEPKLRASPLNNAVIYVDDGTLSVPKGIFILEGSNASFSNKIGAVLSANLKMVEDVFATQ